MESQSYIHSRSSTGPAPALDELLLNINEWRNIQDVVRITFKAFHDVLRQQGDSIKALERGLDTKAGRAEVAAALQHKANSSDTLARIAEIEMLLLKKADTTDMDRRALKTEVDASLRTQMSDVFTIINTKSEAVETRALRESSERQLSHISVELSRMQQRLEDTAAQVHTKAGVVEVGQALAVKADLSDVEDKLRDKPSRRQVSDAIALKADISVIDLQLSQFRQEISDTVASVTRKADTCRVDEFVQRLERLRQRVEMDSDTTSAALRTVSSTFDEALGIMQQKSLEVGGSNEALGIMQQKSLEGQDRVMAALTEGLHDVEERLVSRLDENEQFTSDQLNKKAGLEEVQRWMEHKADLEAMAEALDGRAAKDDVEDLAKRVKVLPQISSRIDSLQRDIANKMAADRAIYSALEGKANIEDVNSALIDVCQELERRAAHEHLDIVARDQASIRALLQQSYTVARWLWKSGQTKGGGAVPWNVQAINTDQANFIWEADKTVVLAMAPGLYRIDVGFYSKQRPIIQVLVNGEPVLSLVNSSSTLIHHQNPSLPERSQTLGGIDVAKEVASLRQSSGNVTGTTATDFLALPASAKIAVTFHGAERAEGFLTLQKI